MTGQLISGALGMGYVVAAGFFLRFWTQTHDRLFAFFSSAFFVLAVQRVLLTLAQRDDVLIVYLLRVMAFALILVAIADKNREARRKVDQTPPDSTGASGSS